MLCKTVSQNNINIQKLLFMSPKDFRTTSIVTRTVNYGRSKQGHHLVFTMCATWINRNIVKPLMVF